jgi:predicted CoA-binding protein
VPGTIDMATVYVQPETAMEVLDECEQKGIPEVWINPGAETDEMMDTARTRKTKVIFACSILGVGRSPREF